MWTQKRYFFGTDRGFSTHRAACSGLSSKCCLTCEIPFTGTAQPLGLRMAPVPVTKSSPISSMALGRGFNISALHSAERDWRDLLWRVNQWVTYGRTWGSASALSLGTLTTTFLPPSVCPHKSTSPSALFHMGFPIHCSSQAARSPFFPFSFDCGPYYFGISFVLLFSFAYLCLCLIYLTKSWFFWRQELPHIHIYYFFFTAVKFTMELDRF